jgi:hypothetical protein
MPIDVYVSREVREWMTSCHPDDDVVATVASAFAFRLQKLAALARLYGKEANDPVKKLQGFRELWEARVRHPTGAYRLFFTFASVGGPEVIAVGDHAVKKGRSLSRRQLQAAERRVDRYVAALAADPRLRDRDRMRSQPP